MQISLTHPELQRFIEDQIKEGLFASASDLVEAADELRRKHLAR